MTDRQHIEDVTLSGTISSYIVDPGTGDEIACEYEDPTEEQRQELVRLEERAEDGDEMAEERLREIVVDDLFKSDKITSDSGLALQQAVIAGLFRGMGANEAVEDAQELFEDLNEGNQ